MMMLMVLAVLVQECGSAKIMRSGLLSL